MRAVGYRQSQSIAAETSGMFSAMSRVKRARVSASPGMTSEGPGTSSTSSKVRPSRIVMCLCLPMP